MSRSLQALLFVVGGGLFAFLLSRAGLAGLWGHASRTGWFFVPIVLSYFVVYAINAWSWRLMMAGEPSRPGYWRTFAITASAFALNYLTPMVQAGGEPYKVAAVSPWLGTRRAVSAVVCWRMLHSLSYLVAWFIGLLLAFVVLPWEARVLLPLGAATVVVAFLGFLLFGAHQDGLLERFLNGLHKVPLLDRVAGLLEPRREALAAMDREIADFYHRDRRRFFQALGLEVLARAVFAAEFWLICYSAGLTLGPLQAYVLPTISSLIQNALFVVPYQLGTSEGAGWVLFELMGFDPTVGVYAAVVSRLRDLSWIAVGLVLIWGGGGALRAGTARADTRESNLSLPEERP